MVIWLACTYYTLLIVLFFSHQLRGQKGNAQEAFAYIGGIPCFVLWRNRRLSGGIMKPRGSNGIRGHSLVATCPWVSITFWRSLTSVTFHDVWCHIRWQVCRWVQLQSTLQCVLNFYFCSVQCCSVQDAKLKVCKTQVPLRCAVCKTHHPTLRFFKLLSSAIIWFLKFVVMSHDSWIECQCNVHLLQLTHCALDSWDFLGQVWFIYGVMIDVN